MEKPLQLGDRLWQEDDCTTNDPMHKHLEQAYQELFGRPYQPADAVRKEDHGDCEFLLMPGEIIVVSSYTGNNAIYTRKI